MPGRIRTLGLLIRFRDGDYTLFTREDGVPDAGIYALFEDRDGEWIKVGTRRVAYYTNIPPGRYTFRVQASNNHGVWNEEGASLSIALAPFFYETLWFYMLSGLLLGLVVYAGYRVRTQAIAASNRVLQDRVRTRTAELRTTQEYLDTILLNLPVGIAIMEGPEFRYYRINHHLAEINGLPVEDHLGRPLAEVLPDAAPDIVPGLQQVFETGKPRPYREFSTRLPKDPDTIRHFIDSFFPIKGADGQPIAVGVTVFEITERKQAEEALRQSEEHYRGVFETVPDSVLVIDVPGRIRDANPAACEKHGYTLEEFVELSLEAIIPSEYHPQVGRAIEAVQKGEIFVTEAMHRRKDGSTFDVEVRVAPYLYEGKPHMLAVIRDITACKQAEEELQRYAERLQALSHRLVEVQEAERHMLARELHDEIGQALTGLNIILKTLTRLTNSSAEEPLNEAQAIIQQVLQQVREMSLRLRPAILDDLGLVPALLWHIDRYTKQTGIEVDFKHLGSIPSLSSHVEVTAYRIIQEGLTNVARHAKVSEVVIRLIADAQHLIIEIVDQGVGFDLQRVAQSRTSAGLSGIQERVALLGGVFDVETGPQAGTRLTAKLPLAVCRRSPL